MFLRYVVARFFRISWSEHFERVAEVGDIRAGRTTLLGRIPARVNLPVQKMPTAH